MNDRTSPAESKVGETAHERAALLDRAKAIVVDAIKRMRAAHVHCQDLLHDAEAFMEDKARAASATETEAEGTCAQCRKPSTTNQMRASGTAATERNCVFRTNVTGRFGIVTGDFGNVTGHLGNVTERTGRQDWRCV